MDQLNKIRLTRQSLKMSQVTLAHLSGVSLPTLQRIELGIANPSLSTVLAIYEALGLTLTVEPCAFDFDELAALGAPVQMHQSVKIQKNKDSLLKAIKSACKYIVVSGKKVTAREREALSSTVFVLRNYYPTVYRELLRELPAAEDFLPKEIDGRLIKHKRLILSALAGYL